jgi:hypothetical protein
VRERRVSLGDAWVNECWRRGVLLGEPEWFFAGEGSIMVGTMWDNPELLAFARMRVTATQALLITREPVPVKPGPDALESQRRGPGLDAAARPAPALVARPPAGARMQAWEASHGAH